MSYQFPSHKLSLSDAGESRELVVLIACGSYSPILFNHLRMFEIARDEIQLNHEMKVIGGYLSPVHDGYNKNGLINSKHRLEMCRLAVDTSDWIMVDDWECQQLEYSTTRKVLDHFWELLNSGKISNRRIRPIMLCGNDLLDSFKVPNLWADEDVTTSLICLVAQDPEYIWNGCRRKIRIKLEWIHSFTRCFISA